MIYTLSDIQMSHNLNILICRKNALVIFQAGVSVLLVCSNAQTRHDSLHSDSCIFFIGLFSHQLLRDNYIRIFVYVFQLYVCFELISSHFTLAPCHLKMMQHVESLQPRLLVTTNTKADKHLPYFDGCNLSLVV